MGATFLSLWVVLINPFLNLSVCEHPIMGCCLSLFWFLDTFWLQSWHFVVLFLTKASQISCNMQWIACYKRFFFIMEGLLACNLAYEVIVLNQLPHCIFVFCILSMVLLLYTTDWGFAASAKCCTFTCLIDKNSHLSMSS